jgi:excisionase family DNA binding protein
MNWMTVKEVAKYLKLSEMMIYKLAQNGQIPASKVGSAWRFSQGEIDNWLLGRLQREVEIKGPVKGAVEDFIAGLKKEYRENLSSVIVFGSYARGEADFGSDIDILVVLKKIPDYWHEKSRLETIAYESTFERKRSVVLAPVLIDENEFLTGSSPLLINVRREGRKAA